MSSGQSIGNDPECVGASQSSAPLILLSFALCIVTPARITEVRPCTPLLERSSTTVRFSGSFTVPWPTDAGHAFAASIGGCPVTPYLFEHITSKHLARLRANTTNWVEFSVSTRSARHCEVTLCASTSVLRRRWTSRQVRRRCGAAAQPHPRNQLLGLERLHDVVVGARLQASTTSTVSVFAVSITIGTPESARNTRRTSCRSYRVASNRDAARAPRSEPDAVADDRGVEAFPTGTMVSISANKRRRQRPKSRLMGVMVSPHQDKAAHHTGVSWQIPQLGVWRRQSRQSAPDYRRRQPATGRPAGPANWRGRVRC